MTEVSADLPADEGPEPIWPHAPRVAPGTPFPCSRFVPGRDPHPRRDPRGSLFEAPEPAPGLPAHRWREDPSYLHGVDLYHQGYLWEAHEYWEAVYHAATDPAHRDLLQALIQLAAALLNAHLGKRRGAEKLVAAVASRLERACAGLDVVERIAGLDPVLLLADVRAWAGGAAPPRLVLSA